MRDEGSVDVFDLRLVSKWFPIDTVVNSRAKWFVGLELAIPVECLIRDCRDLAGLKNLTTP